MNFVLLVTDVFEDRKDNRGKTTEHPSLNNFIAVCQVAGPALVSLLGGSRRINSTTVNS